MKYDLIIVDELRAANIELYLLRFNLIFYIKWLLSL